MRLRNITGSREVIAESPYVVQEAVQPRCPGTWKEIFGNQNPVQIEIGMGKGKFIHTMAKEHPDINYVGIEKYSSGLLRAIQKMEAEELPNLKFLRMDAEDIAKENAKGAELSLDTATTGMAAPFHEGAARYYREHGITVKTTEED